MCIAKSDTFELSKGNGRFQKKVERNFGEIEEIDINEESRDNQEIFSNGVKSGNKSDRIEILQIGEENSLRILIVDEKITEIEKIELKTEDVDDVENFDFGDMIVVGSGENDVKVIFTGAELSDSPDFVNKTAIFDKESVKNIKFSDVVIAGICIIAYFWIYNSIPLQKKTVENEIIQKEIKSLEKDYLKKKAEAKRNQSVTEVKPLRLSPVIDQHDFETKLKKSREWLEDGLKVRIDMRFRGRMITRQEIGREVIERFTQQISDIADVSKPAKLEGNTLSVVYSPKKGK